MSSIVDKKRSRRTYYSARFSLGVDDVDYDVDSNHSLFKSENQGASTNYSATRGSDNGERNNIFIRPESNPIWVKFNATTNDPIYVPADAWFEMYNIQTHNLYLTGASSTAQVQDIVTVADVSSSLNNTYFYIYARNATTGVETTVGVWFDVDSAGTEPTDATVDQWVEVDISANDADTTVAAALDTALEALTINSVDVFDSSVSTATVTVTHNAAFAGSQQDAADSASATGFTFSAPSTEGGDATVVQIIAI